MLYAGSPILTSLLLATGIAHAGDVVVVPVAGDPSAQATEAMVAEELSLALGQEVGLAEPADDAASVWVLPRTEHIDAVVVSEGDVLRFSVDAGELAPAEIAARIADVLTAPVKVVTPPLPPPEPLRLEVGLDVRGAFGLAGYLGPRLQPAARAAIGVRFGGWAGGIELGVRTGRSEGLRTSAIDAVVVGGWRARGNRGEVGPHLALGAGGARVELERADSGAEVVRYLQLRVGLGVDAAWRFSDDWVAGVSVRGVGLPVRDQTQRVGEAAAHDTGRFEVSPALSIRWRR